MILSTRSCSCILGQTSTFYFFYFFQKCHIDSFRIIDPACRIRYGNNFCTHLLCFLYCIDCYVTRSGYAADLIFHIHAVAFHQLTGQVQKSVTSCLSSCKRSAVGQTFSGQNTFIQSGDSLVLSVHITDLTSTSSDISSRNINVCSNIFVKLCNKALAECHDLSVGFTLRIKVRTTFTTTDWKSGQGILEYLLKSKEFDNSDIY